VALQDTSDSRCRDETAASKEKKTIKKRAMAAFILSFILTAMLTAILAMAQQTSPTPQVIQAPAMKMTTPIPPGIESPDRVETRLGTLTGKKAAMEARAIEILRGDPQMRAEFINRVAPPIANKLFECGMIPCSFKA